MTPDAALPMTLSAADERRIAAEIAACVAKADPHDLVSLFHNLCGGSVENTARLRISAEVPDADSLTGTGWKAVGEWKIPTCPRTAELLRTVLPDGRFLGEMLVGNGLITGERAARGFPLVTILDPSLAERRVKDPYTNVRRLGAIATAITYTASGMRRMQEELYPRLSALDLFVPLPGENEGLTALERIIKCFAVWGKESDREALPSCFLASLLLGWLAGHGAEVGRVLNRGNHGVTIDEFWEGLVSQASAERLRDDRARKQGDDDPEAERVKRLERLVRFTQDVLRESPRALNALEGLSVHRDGTRVVLDWAVEKAGIAPDLATLLGRTKAAAALVVREDPESFREPML
jgi:hypothetical protein